MPDLKLSIFIHGLPSVFKCPVSAGSYDRVHTYIYYVSVRGTISAAFSKLSEFVLPKLSFKTTPLISQWNYQQTATIVMVDMFNMIYKNPREPELWGAVAQWLEHRTPNRFE